MHAIICPEFGPPDVLRWEKADTPQPKVGEILIKISYAGLNRADLMQRQGKYPPPEGASSIMGMEVSGEVAAVGTGVQRWKIGDKVCALLSGGGYAEFATAPEGQCLPIPANLSLREAAALPEALATVWANVFESGGLKAGESVLVHGGSSGIGTTAIQMAKLFGAKIFVTVGNEEKAEACRRLGADLVINYQTNDFVAEVENATGKRGVDVVLDMVGGDYVNRNLSVLAPHGRHVSIATQKGRMANVDIGLLMRKRAILTGSTLRGRSIEEKSRIIAEIEKKVWPWVAEGKLKSLVYKSYPIKNAAEAHKMMESGAHIGKIALEVVS